jgi:hypothetical protein
MRGAEDEVHNSGAQSSALFIGNESGGKACSGVLFALGVSGASGIAALGG